MTVFTNFTYLWCGYSGQRSRSSKNEGQDLKKSTKIAFLQNIYGIIFDPLCLFGSCHSSKVKGQGHLKVKFGAIVSYH